MVLCSARSPPPPAHTPARPPPTQAGVRDGGLSGAADARARLHPPAANLSARACARTRLIEMRRPSCRRRRRSRGVSRRCGRRAAAAVTPVGLDRIGAELAGSARSFRFRQSFRFRPTAPCRRGGELSLRSLLQGPAAVVISRPALRSRDCCQGCTEASSHDRLAVSNVAVNSIGALLAGRKR